MKSGWMGFVEKAVAGFPIVCFRPDQSGRGDPDQYTPWDLFQVRRCDVLLAYMEADNPSGFGLTLEVGYAAALDKLVLYVDAKEDPRMDIVKHTADVRLSSLVDPIDFLLSLARPAGEGE
jgi:nucleoside 2-deoxyribosyltransferase